MGRGRARWRICGPAEGLHHRGAGIGVSGDGVGKGLEHKHPALLRAEGNTRGAEGGTQQLRGRKVPQAACSPAPSVAGLAPQQKRCVLSFPVYAEHLVHYFQIKISKPCWLLQGHCCSDCLSAWHTELS